jgi:hypothetical protein
MSNLKKRVEALLGATQISEVREACSEAINKFSGSISASSPYSQRSFIESGAVQHYFKQIGVS